MRNRTDFGYQSHGFWVPKGEYRTDFGYQSHGFWVPKIENKHRFLLIFQGKRDIAERAVYKSVYRILYTDLFERRGGSFKAAALALKTPGSHRIMRVKAGKRVLIAPSK